MTDRCIGMLVAAEPHGDQRILTRYFGPDRRDLESLAGVAGLSGCLGYATSPEGMDKLLQTNLSPTHGGEKRFVVMTVDCPHFLIAKRVQRRAVAGARANGLAALILSENVDIPEVRSSRGRRLKPPFLQPSAACRR